MNLGKTIINNCLCILYALLIQRILPARECVNNDYALCSHAACSCVDEPSVAINCEEYPTTPPPETEAPTAAWSRCTSPIVKNSGSVYNANYAAPDLSCDERAKPSSNSPHKLPNFVNQDTDIYSTYSFGDSAANKNINTRAAAKGTICDSSTLFADCLSMACYIPGATSEAVCYCNKQLPIRSMEYLWSKE